MNPSSKEFLVKKIVEIPYTNNEYGIGRIETWIIQDLKKFPSYEEAERYVIDMSIRNTELVRCMPENLLRSPESSEEKRKFQKEFCFGKHFRKYQRYFIDIVPLQEILELLKKDGIRIDNIQLKSRR
jgi:hypothetical protein